MSDVSSPAYPESWQEEGKCWRGCFENAFATGVSNYRADNPRGWWIQGDRVAETRLRTLTLITLLSSFWLRLIWPQLTQMFKCKGIVSNIEIHTFAAINKCIYCYATFQKMWTCKWPFVHVCYNRDAPKCPCIINLTCVRCHLGLMMCKYELDD